MRSPTFPLLEGGTALPLDAQLLSLLRVSRIPASEIATLLQISVQELHAAVKGLRDAGFEISLHPSLGFHLEKSPEHLIADDILSRMTTRWVTDITVFKHTSSTNDLVSQRGLQGAVGPLAVFAESQSAGRGRFGRPWVSKEKEGLWMSILLRPNLPLQLWPRLTSAAALAIALTIEAATSMRPQIKWPNDVLLSGKKICGLLVETAHHPQHGPFAVLGIGLNVNQTEFPESLAQKASSLRQLTHTHFDRTALAADLLDRLGGLIDRLADFDAIVEQISDRSAVLGRPVEAHAGNETIVGVAESLGPEGQLLVRLPNGSLRSISAGEVTLDPNSTPQGPH